MLISPLIWHCLWLCSAVFHGGWILSEQPLGSAGAHFKENYESASYKTQPGDMSVFKVLEGLALILWAPLSYRFWVSWKNNKKVTCFSTPPFLISNMQDPAVPQSNECRENSLCTDVAVLCNQQTFYKQNWFSSSGLNYRMLGKEEQLTGDCSQAPKIYSF